MCWYTNRPPILGYRHGEIVRISKQEAAPGRRHPHPRGRHRRHARGSRGIAEALGRPVVLKIQAWVTGRAALGGIQFADTPEEAEEKARGLLGLKVKTYVVDRVLVEEKLAIQAEYFAGLVMDDARKVPAARLQLRSAGRASRRSPDIHPERIVTPAHRRPDRPARIRRPATWSARRA